MSPFQEAMHEFVQASGYITAHKDEWRTAFQYHKGMAEEQAERELSAAGDRLEAIFREMIGDGAVKAGVNLGIGGDLR